MTYSLTCESAPCNAGHSAADREAAILHGLPAITAEIRDEADRHARSVTSHQLAVTPHVRIGTNGRGFTIFRCLRCEGQRVYGSSMWGQ